MRQALGSPFWLKCLSFLHPPTLASQIQHSTSRQHRAVLGFCAQCASDAGWQCHNADAGLSSDGAGYAEMGCE